MFNYLHALRHVPYEQLSSWGSTRERPRIVLVELTAIQFILYDISLKSYQFRVVLSDESQWSIIIHALNIIDTDLAIQARGSHHSWNIRTHGYTRDGFVANLEVHHRFLIKPPGIKQHHLTLLSRVDDVCWCHGVPWCSLDISQCGMRILYIIQIWGGTAYLGVLASKRNISLFSPPVNRILSSFWFHFVSWSLLVWCS